MRRRLLAGADPARIDAGARVDLTVIPLGFAGDREALYRRGSGAPLLIHDWLWRRRGVRSTRVALWLLKGLNLVIPTATPPDDDKHDIKKK